jgi:hypothetical protein
VDLAALDDNAGRRVHVGGLVTSVEAGGIRLDDGTATARLVLAAGAAEYLEVLRPGDALNATGTVEAGDEPVIVIAEAADIALLGDLGSLAGDDAEIAGAIDGLLAGTSTIGGGEVPGAGALPTGPGAVGRGAPVPAGVALAVVLLAGAISAAAALGNRRRSNRRSRALVEARLAGIGAGNRGPEHVSAGPHA